MRLNRRKSTNESHMAMSKWKKIGELSTLVKISTSITQAGLSIPGFFYTQRWIVPCRCYAYLKNIWWSNSVSVTSKNRIFDCSNERSWLFNDLIYLIVASLIHVKDFPIHIIKSLRTFEAFAERINEPCIGSNVDAWFIDFCVIIQKWDNFRCLW